MNIDLSKWTEVERFQATDEDGNIYTVIKLKEPERFVKTLDGVHPVAGGHNAYLTEDGLHLNVDRETPDSFTIAENGKMIKRNAS